MTFRLALRPLSYPAALLVGALLSTPVAAQLTIDTASPSTAISGLTPDVPSFNMPTVDVERLLAEDALAVKGTPYRFGEALPVEIDIKELGVVDVLPDGGHVYRLRITSPGAFSLGLGFSTFDLPEGAGLWVHADDGEETYGAYSMLNNKANREFAIQPLAGSALVLEYVEPEWVEFAGEVVVNQVVHDYRNAFGHKDAGYAGGSGSCNNDVNCAVGAPWSNEIRASALIIAGGVLCSGSLVNNTANDGTQYFWTANHCGSMNNAVFRFNYEKSGCGSGGAPTNQTVQGSTLIANNSNVDYRLVRITQAIPDSYDVYYQGFSRSTANPSNTIAIHHPSGDVKKISFDDDPATKSGNQWKISQWDDGVTEGGSSGSPLLDPNGRLIGQLCCGQATCGFPFNDFYGRFDQAWNGVRAALDPLGNNPVFIDGFDPDFPGGGSGDWTSLGGGVGGLLGVPVLAGNGSLQAGATTNLVMSGGLPFGSSFFLLGGSALNAPFKGGVLVPSLDVILSVGLSGSGGSTVSFAWPAGVPSGSQTWYQQWVVDSTAPQNFSGSNGVRGTTP
ncbi:MAG: lysyl endopeptidase [Pseudohongiellaceae bacterium]|jgi:lysyl endopeptidase